MSEAHFRSPDFTAPVDVEAHVARLPPDATTKGMFFTALIERAGTRRSREELLRAARLPESTRFVPFRDYPMAANLRLTEAVAGALFPRAPLGLALRELGRGSVGTFRESHMGRVFLDVIDLDPGTLFRAAPRIFGALFNFGSVECETAGPAHVRLVVRAMPVFIGSFQVGAVESVLELSHRSGTIELALDSLDTGVVDVRWD